MNKQALGDYNREARGGVLGFPKCTTSATHSHSGEKLRLELRESSGTLEEARWASPTERTGWWREPLSAQGLCVMSLEDTYRKSRAQVQEAFLQMLPGEAEIENGTWAEDWEGKGVRAGSAPASGTLPATCQCLGAASSPGAGEP